MSEVEMSSEVVWEHVDGDGDGLRVCADGSVYMCAPDGVWRKAAHHANELHPDDYYDQMDCIGLGDGPMVYPPDGKTPEQAIADIHRALRGHATADIYSGVTPGNPGSFLDACRERIPGFDAVTLDDAAFWLEQTARERDRYISRCRALEAKLAAIREVVK